MADETATMEKLASEAADYRRRCSRGPLPNSVWETAVRLCKGGHSEADVAKAGRMSAQALAARLAGRPSRVERSRRKPAAPRAGFVALRESAPSAALQPSCVEIERADGAKLRLPGVAPSEALALFLGGRA